MDQPFCPRCLPLVFSPYLSTVFRFKWPLGARWVVFTGTFCLFQWSRSLDVVLHFLLCVWPHRKPFFGLPGEIIYLRFSGKMVPMGALLCQVQPVCQRSLLPSSCRLFSLPMLCLLFNKQHFRHWLFELEVENRIMTDVKILFHGLLSKKASGSCLCSDHCEWKLKTKYIMRIFRQIKFFSWDLLVVQHLYCYSRISHLSVTAESSETTRPPLTFVWTNGYLTSCL